jgi:hypothetical protein
MKSIVTRNAILFFATISLIFVGCETNEEEETDTVSFSTENSIRAVKADNVAEVTFNILESGFVENEGVRSPSSRNLVSLFPSCTTITISTNGSGGTIILDFGDSCTLNNGAIVSGIISISYGPIISGTRTINYTFEDYTYNGNSVAGGGEILREISNANGNPQSTVNEVITVSFPNSDVSATREGLRVVEWIQGFSSGTWTDNVYEVSGNWDTNFNSGFSRSGTVTQVLVRRLSCLFVESGKLVIERQGQTAEIDWGNGTCDNMATLTRNGIEYPIILGD